MADPRETNNRDLPIPVDASSVIQRLERGGLIRGIEPVQGSLTTMTGFALERITRERVGAPPELKLPERVVYLLNPDSRRLIMVSNREPKDQVNFWEAPRYGLFAEVVQLDEDGKPQYYLDSSDVILPDDMYQPVAVGSNDFGLPPSHIQIEEGGEGNGERSGKKFVPWNIYLSRLEHWMGQVRVDPKSEDFQAFMQRFLDLKRESGIRVENTIRSAFPRSIQGLDDKMVPVNVIITDQGEDSPLYIASVEAGLYPFLFHPEDLATQLEINKEADMPPEMASHLGILLPMLDETRQKYASDDPDRNRDMGEFAKRIAERLREKHGRMPVNSEYSVAVVTSDDEAIRRIAYDGEERARRGEIPNTAFGKYRALLMSVDSIIEHNTIFSVVNLGWNRVPGNRVPEDVAKLAHGDYYCPPDEEDRYRGLLNKIKADLFLTMFLRGGAPIVK